MTGKEEEKGERVSKAPYSKYPTYVVLAIVGLLVGIYLWDPNGNSINDKSWTEDVKLASGEVLKVKRRVRFREGFAWGGGYSTGQAFETSELEWATARDKTIRWKAPMMALYIDREPDSGEWIVVAGGGSVDFYQLNGSPCPPQWAFRFRRGTWYVQPVPTSLIGRQPSLLFEFRVSDDRRFPYPSFRAEVERRKARFESHPNMDELRLFTIGTAGNFSKCEGLSPRFTGAFAVNETIPGISQFPRLP